MSDLAQQNAAEETEVSFAFTRAVKFYLNKNLFAQQMHDLQVLVLYVKCKLKFTQR